MRDLTVLFLHLLATVARLAGPGGTRSVVAESLLVKQQLLILNRSRKRAPNLGLTDRVVAGVCVRSLYARAGWFRGCLEARHALPHSSSAETRKCRLLFSPAV